MKRGRQRGGRGRGSWILARLREREAKLAAAGLELVRGAGGERVVAASAVADDRRIIH